MTSLVYRAYVHFGLAGLPAEFAQGGSYGDDAMLFNEIVDLLPTLSDADQANLKPFVARPTEPDSVFSAARGPVLAGFRGGLSAAANECRDWVDSGAGDARFKVWACAGSDAGAAVSDIAIVSAQMASIWGPMTAAAPAGMGPPIPDASGTNVSRELGGDGRIDIYLLADGDGVHRDRLRSIPGTAVAAAIPSPPYYDSSGQPLKTSSGFMLVNRTRIGEPKKLRLDLIHEFFHVLQNAHNRKATFKGEVQHWFNEASATWAETYFDRPDSAEVHTWFQGAFQNSSLGLESADPDHQYAAYIWPFFMEQEVGPGAIFNAWIGIESAGSEGFNEVTSAINSQLAFDSRFRDFAVRNFNLELEPITPAQKRYVDLDEHFPDKVPPGLIEEGTLTKDATYRSASLTIEPLAAVYLDLTPETYARDVTFDLSELGPGGAIDGDVLLHTFDGWRRQPIENGTLHLCRDKTAEDFDEAIVVLSNHSRDVKVEGLLLARTKAECGQGTYVIDVAGDRPGAGHYTGGGRVGCFYTAAGGWGAAAVYYVDDPVNPAKDIIGFDISSRSVAVTLVDTIQQTEGPGWFVDDRLQGVITVTVDDTPEMVTITAHASGREQSITIVAVCSTVRRP